MEKPALGAADFRCEPFVSYKAASTRIVACTVSAHSEAVDAPQQDARCNGEAGASRPGHRLSKLLKLVSEAGASNQARAPAMTFAHAARRTV